MAPVLFVSHNRYFIDHIKTRVLSLTERHGVQKLSRQLSRLFGTVWPGLSGSPKAL